MKKVFPIGIALLVFFLPNTSIMVPLFAHSPKGSSCQAKIIYREPASWSSSAWINIGRKHHIKKGSPVLARGSLIGVVERVEKRKSLIRLITDRKLVPSVRVVRGDEKSQFLLDHLQILIDNLPDEEALASLKERLSKTCGNTYLAKGEVMGSSAPLWRSRSELLKGIGFNYDFADDKGPARPLQDDLIQEGDLLVTTGMDGLFPPGLRVATVARVAHPAEGDIAYDIEARLTAGNLDTLVEVDVLCERHTETPLPESL